MSGFGHTDVVSIHDTNTDTHTVDTENAPNNQDPHEVCGFSTNLHIRERREDLFIVVVVVVPSSSSTSSTIPAIHVCSVSFYFIFLYISPKNKALARNEGSIWVMTLFVMLALTR